MMGLISQRLRAVVISLIALAPSLALTASNAQ
jgi:hypothetical protein